MDESSNRGTSVDSSDSEDEYFDAQEPPDSEDEYFDALQPQEPDEESDKESSYNMDDDQEWDKPKYKNWVRGAKGLEYLQEGLHTFVGDRVLRQRDQTVQRITSVLSPGSPIQCNQCTPGKLLPKHTVLNCNKNPCIQKIYRNCFGSKPNGRRKCKNGICSQMYDEIVNAHLFKDPLWKHSDPSTWCSDPLGWSFAKCFQTTPNPGTSAAETDAAGLLSIILSDDFFQSEVACDLTLKGNIFSAAREARNSILHNPIMELEEPELQRFVDTFIQVLQDAKYLLNDQRATQSVQNLIQLKSKQINISQMDEKNILKIRKEALAELEEVKNEAVTEIQDSIRTGLTDLNTNRADALRELSTEKNEALEQIKGKISASLTEMTEKDNEVLNEISKGNTDALANIKDATSAGLSELNEKSAYALTLISEERTDILERIKDTASAAIAETTDARKEAEQKISAAGTEVLETLYDRKQKILTEFEEAKSNLRINEPLSAEMKTHILGKNEAYLKMRTELQDDLIESYRQEHSTIVLAPLADEKCTPLLPFYVMPDIQTIKINRSPGVGEEERTLVKPFRNVFYSGNNVLRQIYLTADAGLGKSAFCKRLALTWCQAKKPIKDEKRYFSQEEIEALAEFDFIFLLMLRDSSEECEIDDMILNQLIPKLANTDDLQRDDLKKITNKESCLVILDGLDEWTHSSTKSCKSQHGQIPYAKARQWTVLTTTRPWKLSLSGLSSCQIDQRLEITGLSRESADKLKRSVIAHLYGGGENKLEQYVNDFNRAAQGKHISDLEAVPLLLMYMLFLRHDNKKLGQSLCELYSKIIELLLSRTVDKRDTISPKSEHTQDSIPQCLSENELCKQFYTDLTHLGRLAFQTLFKETRDENTLVFSSSVAKQYLNEQCLKFCLKTGMITESKIQGKLLKQESKVSFAHKTIQEFFAALYICSIPDQTSVPETVLSKCTCVKDILEMSKILIFLSGFNVNVSSSISRELMKIINEDEITREYRSSLQYSAPLKQFQDMCVSCCKELPHENDVNFCLQDVFIKDSCDQEQYREKLKQLTSRNKQNIRSLHIDIDGMSRTPYSSAQKVIEYFALSDLENIDKIYYRGEYNDRDILPLLKSSVKSLSLWCSKSSWSVLLYEKVTSLQNLEAIDISRFKMSHEQLTLLYDYISQRQCMRDIELWYLDCTDHERRYCTGRCLNLSKHSKLRKIILAYIPVSELNINMSSLEECVLEGLSNPDLVLRFINCVPADSKVNIFMCSDLKSSAAIETIQQTLPLLVHVKYVWLEFINLGNRNLLSTEMVNIKLVHLDSVTMPASVVRGIVTVLQQLTQTVTVEIKWCNITPESEFVTVKKEIKQSSQFRVSEDWEDGSRKYLMFETIKDGD